ncbi:MAG: polysaccharide biosynthesis tyrosine autokinase [Rikenellaceae bacterium]
MNNQFVTLKDIWEAFINNIFLFITSIILALILGTIIYLKSAPIFERTTSILIKDEQSSNPLLESLGLEGSNADIKNEIQILSNPELIYQVIIRKNLDKNLSYKQKNLRWIDLYRELPVKIILDEKLQNKEIYLKFKTNKNNEFKISKLKIGDEKIRIKGLYKFGQKIKTRYGEITINKTENLPSNQTFKYTQTDAHELAKEYTKMLNVSLRDNSTSIIDLSISLGSKLKADDLLNTLIEVYNENYLFDATQVNQSTQEFIDERLTSLAKELDKIDKDISDYKSQNLIVDFSATSSLEQTFQSENQRKLIELNNSLAVANYIKDFIEENQQQDKLLPLSSGLYSNSLETQIAQYNEAILRLDYLSRNSGVNNPLIAEQKQNIKSLKQILSLSIKDYINALSLQIQSEEKNETKHKNELTKAPLHELYLLSKIREQKIKEELYLFLLQKREENSLTKTFTSLNTKILSFSTGEKQAKSPNLAIILTLSFLSGLALATFYIIIKKSLDTAIKTKDDLESCIIPYLGYVPSLAEKTNTKRRNPSEAFKVLRSNLDFLSGDNEHCKIIQIISLIPSSGKTLVCANLAKTISLKSSRVLILDCDMRVAAMSKLLGMPRVGLANILNGNTTKIEDVIIKNAFNENLDAIAVGILPPNPSELLLNKKFGELIGSLKPLYDYIFLDCPPIEIVSDSLIVAKSCTNTIFVVRAELFDKRSIPELNKIYNSGQYKNMSLVLNDVKETNQKQYGGYSGYGSKYGENPDDDMGNIIGFHKQKTPK